MYLAQGLAVRFFLLRRATPWTSVPALFVLGCNAILGNAEHDVAADATVNDSAMVAMVDDVAVQTGDAAAVDVRPEIESAPASGPQDGAHPSSFDGNADGTAGQAQDANAYVDTSAGGGDDARPVQSASADVSIDRGMDASVSGMCAAQCATTVAGATSFCDAGQCVTQCASSSHTVCEYACVNLNSDTANCGHCGNACPAAATCVSGACVCPTSTPTACLGQCVNTNTNRANCSTCGHGCIGSCLGATCQCVTPTPTNLIVNGGFDTGVTGWTWPQPTANLAMTWSPMDVAECRTSGALRATYGILNSGATFSQCVQTTPGATYDFGGWVRVPSGGGRNAVAVLTLDWRTAADCSGTNVLSAYVALASSGAWDTWESLTKDGIQVPPGALSAVVSGEVDDAYFDMIYLTPQPGHF